METYLMVAVAWDSIYQSIKGSTATNRGNSYWETSANCGEMRHLADLHKEVMKNAETNEEEKKQGSFYHGLKDAYYKGGLPTGRVIEIGSTEDLQYANAVRLFNFSIQHFGGDYWGQCVASEYGLPTNEDHTMSIRTYFGHEEVTGAADGVFWLSSADVARIEADRKCELRGPGLYLIDWKTAGARKSEKAAQGAYLNSIQAKVYPLLWNLQGGEQCRGMIFDVLVDHTDLRLTDEGPKKLSSVQTFFAPWNEVRDRQARAAVNFAKMMRDQRLKNPYACDTYKGEGCPFAGKFCDGGAT